MNRSICKTIALAFLLASAAATASYGTVFFQNTGVKAGWSSTSGEHNGTTTSVSNPTYKGSKALRMRQIYDPNYNGRYHAEAAIKDMKKRGWERYYGWAFRVSSSWQYVNQNYCINQFIANIGCPSWRPTTMTHLQDTKIRTRIKFGTKCTGEQTTNYNALATFKKGVWHAVIIRGKWESNNTGIFKFWFDYKKKVEKTNLATTLNTDSKFQFRVGLYANGWHDQGQMVGTQGTRTVWVDNVRVTSTYSEAKPNSW